MTPEQQLQDYERQVSKMYVSISDTYKRMSKIKDAYRLDIMQSGVNGTLLQVSELRGMIKNLQAAINAKWIEQGKTDPFPDRG